MKKLTLVIPALLLLVGCSSSNPSEGEIEGMFLSDNVVAAGANTTTSVTFRVAATESGSEYISQPLSLLLNLPVGVDYIPGTSALGFQGPRAPDAVGSCANGTTFLSYNLLTGEIEDPFNFDSFSSVINFVVTVQPIASEARAFGVAAPGLNAFSDPCNAVFTEDVKYRVNT